jgi:hypothetical protein
MQAVRGHRPGVVHRRQTGSLRHAGRGPSPRCPQGRTTAGRTSRHREEPVNKNKQSVVRKRLRREDYLRQRRHPLRSCKWYTASVRECGHYLLLPVDGADLIEGVDGRRKATVHTEYSFIDNCTETEVVEDLGAVAPHVHGAILTQALVVKAIPASVSLIRSMLGDSVQEWHQTSQSILRRTLG